MAATLTDAGELTYVSFPIEKTETTADGDLVVYGKASDGSVDHDQQIVDPEYARKAVEEWFGSGANIRVQHNAQRDPAGVGIDWHHDGDATWVKALVCEPVAKKLVAKGALRAYSVGIARPTIVRDQRARGGRITDGPWVEISLVDRPANKSCGIALVKSTADGTPEYVGKVFGADDAIAKALDGETLEKSAPAETVPDTWTTGFSGDLSVTFTPADMAKLLKSKIIEQHYDELAFKAVLEAEAGVYKRDIDTATRRRLAADGKALPNLSYPIENAGDLDNAATLARSGHGDVAAARRLIARRARELGVANPLDESDEVKKSESATVEAAAPQTPEERLLHDIFAEKADAPEAAETAVPDVTKEPVHKPVKKAKKKPKKLPPWLNKPADDDGGSDGKGNDGDGDDGASKACKSVTDHLWTGVEGTSDIVCSKCHTTPAQAAGVTASPMDPAPVGDLMESNAPASVKGATPQSASGAADAAAMKPASAHREPDGPAVEAFEADAGMSDGDSEGGSPAGPAMKASPEVAVLLRFKAAGIDADLGRLHDLTCPAYHPDEVAKYHPFADLASLIDEGAWARKALDAATGPLEQAVKMDGLHRAAVALKGASEADLNDWRLEAHKAFRDANPGPATYPTPGSISPQRYRRPCLTEGRAAESPGYGPPNTSPLVATSAPDAHSFDRPPLASAHASPSPSFMKWTGGEYPSQTGVPTQLSYAHVDKDRARMALMQMHDHLSRQFPEVCPLDTVSLDGRADRPLRGVQPERHPVPATAGIGKSDAVPAVLDNGYVLRKSAASPAPVAASFKAQPEQDGDMFADADVYKSFKKMRKRLGKKVLSGKMTVDEARAKMGRQFAQKGVQEPAEAVQKTAATQFVSPVTSTIPGAEVVYMPATPAAPPVAASFDPEVIKAAVAEATTELKDLLVKQQQDMAAQQETFTAKLAEQQRVIDAIADQPDPSTAAFHGLAFNPVRKSAARPAGVTEIAEAAARARRATERELENLYNSATDPYAREGYYATLARMRGGAPDS